MRVCLIRRCVADTASSPSSSSSLSAHHTAWQLKARCNHALRTFGASVPPEVFVYRANAYYALGKPYFALADYDTAGEALGSLSPQLPSRCLRALEYFPATQTGVFGCTDTHMHLFVEPFLDARCRLGRLSAASATMAVRTPPHDPCAAVADSSVVSSESVSWSAMAVPEERGLFAQHRLPKSSPVMLSSAEMVPWMRYPTRHECCAHCTRPLAARVFSCRNSKCHEEYCSRVCRDAALSSYHGAVCYNEHFQSIELDLYERLAQAADGAKATRSEFDALAVQLLLLRVIAAAVQRGKTPSAMAELCLLSGRLVFSPQEASHTLRQLYHRLVRALRIRTSFSYEDMFAVLARLTANTVHTAHGIELSLPCAMLNHSCEPNVGSVGGEWGGSGAMVTLREVSAGEELTRCYLPGCDVSTLSWRQRQAMLKQAYGFDCRCDSCARQCGTWASATADTQARVPP